MNHKCTSSSKLGITNEDFKTFSFKRIVHHTIPFTKIEFNYINNASNVNSEFYNNIWIVIH